MLPISSIYRILAQFYSKEPNFDEKLIIDFFIDCMIQHGEQISHLPLFKFEDKAYLLDKLNEKMSQINFNAIDQKLIFQGLYQRTQKIEANFLNKIEEMEQKHRNMMDEQRLYYEGRIYQLNNKITNLSNFQSQNGSVELFNKLKGESQAMIISAINESIHNDSIEKVHSLLSFLTKANKKFKTIQYINLNSNDQTQNILNIQSFESVVIRFETLEMLYENNSIDSSEFVDVVSDFDNIYLEISHPKKNSVQIANIIFSVYDKYNMHFSILAKNLNFKDHNISYLNHKYINMFIINSYENTIPCVEDKGYFESFKNINDIIFQSAVTSIENKKLKTLYFQIQLIQ